MYGIELDRVPKEYLWGLFGNAVSPWEAAELCRFAGGGNGSNAS
jgi:hypothetical protein